METDVGITESASEASVDFYISDSSLLETQNDINFGLVKTCVKP